jgi:hypothetical protein
MRRSVARQAALVLGLFVLTSCGKFRQANECGTFAKTVNEWLAQARAPAKPAAGIGDLKLIAQENRALATRYDELNKSLWSLQLESEELAPRAARYREIANKAAIALREVADDLDRNDLEAARHKRVEFDTIARSEPPLVQEINRICR